MKASSILTTPTYVRQRAEKTWRTRMIQILLWAVGIAVLLIFLLWLGLQIPPAPFPTFAQSSGNVETIALPQNLPAPVARFYQKMYGDKIPVIKSAVFTGRAEMRPFGPLMLPARFRFTHVTGQAYRHYIEVTLFGFPIMQVNERYVDQHARMETPAGIEEGENLDQGANLGLWSETVWIPAVYLTDPRVRWEAVDENTSILVVPFKDNAEEHYVVRFNPQTGLIEWMESMRYHGAASTEKVLWLNQSLEWETINGQLFNTRGAAIWMDDGKPWAIFEIEDIRLNVDVSEYIRVKGP